MKLVCGDSGSNGLGVESGVVLYGGFEVDRLVGSVRKSSISEIRS